MRRDVYTRIVVILGILIFSALVYFAGVNKISISLVVGKALTAATITVLFDIAFTKWIWKWKIINPYLVKTPNLNGTWIGQFKSSWIDPETNAGIPPIDVKVFIRQSLTNVSVEVYTDKMISTSFLAGIRIEPDTENYELVYTYTSRSTLETREKNPWHDGSTKLQLFNGSGMRLVGEYWTTRKTTGSIEIHRKSTDIERD